jgi:hypothetical protein
VTLTERLHWPKNKSYQGFWILILFCCKRGATTFHQEVLSPTAILSTSKECKEARWQGLEPTNRVEALLLPANVRLGLKWMVVTNTLAYFNTATITTVMSFKVLAPGLTKWRLAKWIEDLMPWDLLETSPWKALYTHQNPSTALDTWQPTLGPGLCSIGHKEADQIWKSAFDEMVFGKMASWQNDLEAAQDPPRRCPYH